MKTKYEILQTFSQWLRDEIDSGCVSQADKILEVIETNTPRLTASQKRKGALIQELYSLKVDNLNETVVEFTNRTVIAFK